MTPLRVRTALVAAAIGLAATLMQGCAGYWETSGSGGRATETVVHTVGSGESLRSIADDYYGDPGAAAYLAEVNGVPEDVVLDEGSVIDVPVDPEDLDRYRARTEAKSHYNRGTALAAAGDLPRSEEAFRRALELDPRFVDAAYNLGVVLLERGESNRAAVLLEQTSGVRPDDAEVRFAWGKALFECGRHARAAEEFRTAVALDPTMEDPAYALGLALLAAGKRQEGIVALDGYLRRFPDGRWVTEARRRLTEMAAGPAPGDAQ
ncbi:MAG: tetratricopeptide repeat protein [Candidatus Eisenbacteria bacterium]|nr:tetratricopeptide repeat protein [Candidatus Eisenbacteria bacterium]